MIGQTVGHYRLQEQLGAGGMGEVYRAHDTRLQRDVALKVLPTGQSGDPTARKRFRQEALALSRFNHPNIATIHDYDTDNGTDFLVMELVRGTPLSHRVASGPLSEREVIAVGVQIAEGLAAAHSHGVLHRDLKPANLAITPDGRVKILDFGLALLLRTTESTPTLLHADRTAGTLAYMSPEQINGTKVDERSDIYSGGAVLYELATGKRPFDASSPGPLIHAILNEAPPPPSTTNNTNSRELDRIILKALDKDPALRYQSANELLVDLKRLTGSPAAIPSRTGEKTSRRILIGAVVAASIAIVAAIALVNRSGATAPRPQHSIAVLRFENASGNPDDDPVAFAVSLDILQHLFKSSALGVTNASSSFAVKPGTPAAEAARRLSVDKVVNGTVQRNGDRLLVEVWLLDGETGQQEWSESYDRPSTDLSLTVTIARAIFDRLGVKLTTLEKQRLVVDAPDERRVQARDLHLQGRYYQSVRPPQPAKSREMFEKAIAVDPTYAPPYSMLAMNFVSQGMFTQTTPPMQFYPKAKELALKTLQLEQNDPQHMSIAHTVLAMTKLHHEWDWDGAEREFKRAIELNPSTGSGHHWYAHLLLTLDRIEESVTESERASELDPFNVMLASCVGWHCLYARRFEQAVARSQQAVEMDPSQFAAHYYLGRAFNQQKRLPEAIASFQQAVELSKGAPPVLAALGYAYASAGQKREAEEVLDTLTKRSRDRYIPAYDFAVVHAGLGDTENVFEWLEKAYLERSSWLVHVKWDERFAAYRSDPRFAHLLRRIGVPV